MKYGLFFVCIMSFGFLNAQQVRSAGAAKNVMMGIDLSANILVDTLLHRPHLFGVGPVDRLQGEITIYDGKAYVHYVQDGKVLSRKAEPLRAPFLAYTYQENWEKEEEEAAIYSQQALQEWIEMLAEKASIDTETAFPFIISGEFKRVLLHIIMKDWSQEEHSHEIHRASKVMFDKKDVSGRIVGFYSRHHEGIFTHKGSFIHVHFIQEDGAISGHLDDIEMEGLFEVGLPRN